MLTPERYVGTEAKEADAEPFAEKMARLSGKSKMQFTEGDRIQTVIQENLRRLGFSE